MNEEKDGTPEFVFTIKPTWEGPLIPEQSASLGLILRNTDRTPREIEALDNPRTPVVRVLDVRGALFEGTPEIATERIVGAHTGEPFFGPPTMTKLLPGQETKGDISSLWDFGEPLGPGRFFVEAEHVGTSFRVRSNRVPFEVVSAEVRACALGYEGPARGASLLAWTAAPAGDDVFELYVRVSGFSGHEVTQLGAYSFGPAPAGTMLAASQIAFGGAGAGTGWIAMLSASGHVELIRHVDAHLHSRTGAIILPVSEVQPVPRFPDRGHAVFMATGKAGGRAALAGVVARAGEKTPTPWVVPLAAQPSVAAVAFGPTGNLTLLLASDDGSSSRISLLEVAESGKVVSPEQVVRSTPNRVAAIAVDMRLGVPPVFLVLELDRAAPNRLSVLRVPVTGKPVSGGVLAPIAGWPTHVDAGIERPARIAELAFEAGTDGTARIAVVDELGRLFGGRIEGGALSVIYDASKGPAHCPHIAALRGNETITCFLDDGSIYRSEGH